MLPAGGVNGRVPADSCASILIRALTYDRDLRERAGDSLTLAVVYDGASSTSVSAADAALAAFKQHESRAVQGLTFRVIRVPYGPDLAATLEKQDVDVIFLVDGLTGDLGALFKLTRRHKILTLTADETEVRRGAAIGVVLNDGKPALMVNLPASAAEGAQLSSELLRLAEVIH